MNNDQGTFWEHVEVLRNSLIQIAGVLALCTIAAFVCKEWLFAFVFAPKASDFVTFEWLGQWMDRAFGAPTTTAEFTLQLISTELTAQFMSHMKVAFGAGVAMASPFILYKLFRFILPALYQRERYYSIILFGMGYVMFLVGCALNYLLLFPLTLRFLATYQVSPEVVNMISIHSYISTFLMTTVAIGVVFEIPVVSWFLAKIGVLKARFMRQYRRHAIVAILVLAAIITPTTDLFTLMLVALPMVLLFQISIVIVQRVENKATALPKASF